MHQANMRSYLGAAGQSARQAQILIADDDRVTATLLTVMIEKYGWRALVAHDAAAALHYLQSGAVTIDVAILDRELPVLSGIDLFKCMQANPQTAGIPVIMYTGTEDAAARQQSIDAGIIYYLVKPVPEAVLKSAIDVALRNAGSKGGC